MKKKKKIINLYFFPLIIFLSSCQLKEEIAQIRDNIKDKLIPKTDEQYVIQKDKNQSKIKKKFAEKNIEDTELIKNKKKKENLEKSFTRFDK